MLHRAPGLTLTIGRRQAFVDEGTTRAPPSQTPEQGYHLMPEALFLSADETFDLGNEFGSPVTTDYGQRKFSGKVNWVEIEVGLDDHNHLIRPEDRLNLAMAFQQPHLSGRLQSCELSLVE